MKKVMLKALALTLVFVMSAVICLAASPAVEITNDASDATKVTIEATHPDGASGAGKEITVLVLKPGATAVNENTIAYINQGTTDENGKVSFTTQLEDVAGEYSVKVGGTSLDAASDTVEVQAAAPSVTYGDIDGTPGVALTDAIMVMKSVAGTTTLTAAQQTAADVDGTAGVALTDAITIMKYVAGTITTFPVEQ